MTQITQMTAFAAANRLLDARDDLMTYARSNCERHAFYTFAFNSLAKAADALGYRLVPLTQDKPDSGRASIPETEPEVGEQV